MGRKKKHSSAIEGNRTVEELEEREEIEELLGQFPPIRGEPPSHLGHFGKKEWRRLLPGLELLGVSMLDQGMLETYCTWYQVYRKAEKELSNQVIITEIGSKDQKTLKRHPAIDVLNVATNQMKSISSNMGMTLDSRMRLVRPEGESDEDDPFADL
ncbi:phage terminase small subunit P27 family [Carnobacterium maltaromaticum]|uniref:Phage terminase small subunit P27 family n=1 Tax=Carnobacterium maltaromaticum TaxID=2751 RepID=A0AAW9JS62_CARML|nr:phage terminase small subunit P27 family [Carnobacterium maltaromaticum]KRN62121.1 hypothetical protein IV70_GL000217 [Carnobacterium maltaromaticum DSM 20342]MDZ5759352.1 phage terminase small subunit P27 family [Carnobacterium maltaromaticum]